MLEASRRETRSLEEEVARLRPVAASADDLREDLSRAVAETNEARLNAENWKNSSTPRNTRREPSSIA